MNSLKKILVVDNGNRTGIDPLSAELAELGVSSVTTSFEAADDVLNIIERPAAIFLKMPRARQGDDYESIVAFSDQLRQRGDTSGVPVIVWDTMTKLNAGGISEILRRNVGEDAFSGPEL